MITDLPRLAGSNAWAVAPERSASGSALLACDPHLEVNRLPAVWYEAELHWDDNYVLGASLPGCPLFAVARTRDVAWVLGFGKRFDRDSKVIYDGNHKLIWNSTGNHELYDVADDPAEENNLYGKMPELEKRLLSRLTPLIEESQRASAHDMPEIDADLRDALKSLGYVQ